MVQRSVVHLRCRTDCQHPLNGEREHQDLMDEGTLSGHHQQGLAGIQGPRLSEGNRLLHPGYQGQRRLNNPQTQCTLGWWCPINRNMEASADFSVSKKQ